MSVVIHRFDFGIGPFLGLRIATVDSQVRLFADGSLASVVLIAALSVAAACLWLGLLSRFAPTRSRARLRLDWYLPALRRDKGTGEGTVPGSALWSYRLARAILPASWFSDRQTKRRGRVRVGLRKLGITWLAAPLRRLAQTVCLLLFLSLFFYVCWPYDAVPRAAGEISNGWRFIEFGQSDMRLRFASPAGPDPTNSDPSSADPPAQGWRNPEWLIADGVAFLTPADVESSPDGTIGPRVIGLRIEQVDDDGFEGIPLAELSDSEIDRLLIGTAAWSIHSLDPAAWPSHYADNLTRKEWVSAELFLAIDPLVSLSTAIASRSWVWSLATAAAILIVCLLVPRGFCGYVCPLGTLIDLFDWSVGRRVSRFRVAGDGWWVHIKYFLLAGTLVAACFGVLVSGYVSAIPVITRGMLVIGGPIQNGTLRGWHLVPTMHWGHLLSLVMFFGVLGLGLLRPRFWCKYVCPSGATFSLGNLFRLTERKVESSCIHCNKCVEICPFDAIKPDFTTRVTDCTLCQTCAGVCPTHAIKFVERGNLVQLKIAGQPPTGETAIGRRGFLSLAGGTVAAVAGGTGIAVAGRAWGANLDDPQAIRPVRPPGSVPEKEFLEMCIRCGECFQACPNDVLQLQGFAQGFAGLWTPVVNANWAGCESSCNACGQVCPTGAIRAMPLLEKRVTRMGLAIVNETTCLPFAGREACDLCVQECDAAGYHAIEYTQVGTRVDGSGDPIPNTGFLAPVVRADLCVGCGLCQTRCFAINVKDRGLIAESAIVIEAGEGKEDRLMRGPERESDPRSARQTVPSTTRDDREPDFFVPDSPATPATNNPIETDPFGLPPADQPSMPQPPDTDPFGLPAF